MLSNGSETHSIPRTGIVWVGKPKYGEIEVYWHKGGDNVLTNKICKECSVVYVPKGPAQKYCSVCQPLKVKESSRRRNANQRLRDGRQVGVGSGNAQGRGNSHHTYKNGIKGFQKRKLDSMSAHKCERCGKDLTESISTNKYMCCIHHRDHDRNNNELSNHELLCKRCHQLEHKCQDNFYKV
jgi:5-methylcytosine-specific restriction endonuclease McrA